MLYIDTEPNLQFRTSVIGDHIRTYAGIDHSDVAGGRAKETVFGPVTTANIVEDIKQFFDGRFACLRIRGVCRASFSCDDHAHRSFRARCQTTVSRLAVNQVLTFPRQRRVCLRPARQDC